MTGVKCGTGDQDGCPRGQVLRLSGENLAATRRVVFLGGRGEHDDRSAQPEQASPHRVIVEVPPTARSGRLRVVGAAATATGTRLRVLEPPVAPPAPFVPVAGGVFPVQGPHGYGTEVNRFGFGRNHEGQDVFAACATPIVAALPGQVTLNRFHSRAGNYAVIRAAID